MITAQHASLLPPGTVSGWGVCVLNAAGDVLWADDAAATLLGLQTATLPTRATALSMVWSQIAAEEVSKEVSLVLAKAGQSVPVQLLIDTLDPFAKPESLDGSDELNRTADLPAGTLYLVRIRTGEVSAGCDRLVPCHRVLLQTKRPTALLLTDGTVFDANESFYKLIGSTAGALVGQLFAELIATPERADYRNRQRLVANGVTVSDAPFHLSAGKGRGRTVQLVSELRTIGPLTLVSETMDDITDRERNEAALLSRLHATERLADIARTLQSCLRITQAGNAVAEIFRRTFGFDIAICYPRFDWCSQPDNDRRFSVATAGGISTAQLGHDLASSFCGLPLFDRLVGGSGKIHLFPDVTRPASSRSSLDDVSRAWGKQHRVRSILAAPLSPAFHETTATGAVVLLSIDRPTALTSDDVNLCGSMCDVAGTGLQTVFLYEQLLQTRQTLLEQATTDDLTKLSNRAHLQQALASEFVRAQRYQSPLSILLFDIDSFKRFNTLHGHLVGDRVLQHVADAARAVVRRSDLVGRFGGDEFVIVAVETHSVGAMALAERLIRQVSLRENLPRELQDVDGVQISVGVSTFEPNDSAVTEPLQLIRRADDALHLAKANGKNAAVNWSAPNA